VLEARLQLMQAQVEPHFSSTRSPTCSTWWRPILPSVEGARSLIHYLRAADAADARVGHQPGRELDMARAFLEINRVRMASRWISTSTSPTLSRHAPSRRDADHAGGERGQARVDPCCEHGSITIRAMEAGGTLRVSVEDTARASRPRRAAAWASPTSAERLKALYGASAKLVIEERRRARVASIEVPAAGAA